MLHKLGTQASDKLEDCLGLTCAICLSLSLALNIDGGTWSLSSCLTEKEAKCASAVLQGAGVTPYYNDGKYRYQKVERLHCLATRRCSNLRCTAVREVPDDVIKSKVCTACKIARYCSVECQKSDWKNHKAACKKAENQAAAVDE